MILEFQDGIEIGFHVLIMAGDDDGLTGLFLLLEDFTDPDAVLFVEMGGRFRP